MMTLGTDTGFYAELPLEEALEHLAALGWREVQVSAGHIEAGEGLEAHLAAVRKTCDRLGVTVRQVHADVELGPADEHLAAHVTWLGHAGILGTPCLITHANQDADYTTTAGRDRCLRLNRDCLAAVASHAAELGLRVAIENRLERPRAKCRRFGARMRDLLDLIAAVGAENVGVCLDTSHTRVSRLSFSEEIGLCGTRLFATQLSDSDGETQHRMPFTLDIDWHEVVSSLRGIGYEGLLSLDAGVGPDASIDERDRELAAFRERFTRFLDGPQDT